MDLLERTPVLTSTQLWIIDDDSLQSRILSAMLAEQLSLNTNVVDTPPTTETLNKHTGTQLALINCQKFSLREIEAHLNLLNKSMPSIKVALFNLSTQADHSALIKWPQVMAMFEEDSDQKQLIKGLSEVINQGYWLPRHLVSHILNTQRTAPIASNNSIKLTKREIQILEHLSQGLTNAQIGSNIHVSEHTVRSHLYNIYKKIGAKNRIQASSWSKLNIATSG